MAFVLEDIVTTIKTLSFYGHYKDLCDHLGKSSEFLIENNQHLDTVLNALDLKQHSLGYLFVLLAKFHSKASICCNFTPDDRFVQARKFILACNEEQIRLAPETFAELCHVLTEYLTNIKLPLVGIFVLKVAITKLRVCDTQLTSIHADLCQLSLEAGFYDICLEILNVDITEIRQEMIDNSKEAKYFLLYYYCGGLIYLSIRNFHRALYFFKVGVRTPGQILSPLLLDSYKKYILLSLIVHGKVHTGPENASKKVNLFIKPLSKTYNNLANAFMSNNRDEFNDIINKHKKAFIKDYNLCLVKQVSAALYKKNIQRLTEDYLSLSLSDVASRVGLCGPLDAERYIKDMIENKEIQATINVEEKMVVFREEPDKKRVFEVLKKLKIN